MSAKIIPKKKISFDPSDSESDSDTDSVIESINGLSSDSASDSELDSELDVDNDHDSDNDNENNDEDGDTCALDHIDSDSEDSDVDIIDEIFEEEIAAPVLLPMEKRITKPVLTKYERVRLIGDRTRQLASGAKPMLKNIKGLSSLEVAKLELEHNMIPLIIERPLPNNLKERWFIHELEH